MPPDVTLVTCAKHQDLIDDDQHLRRALEVRGARVRVAIWNDPAIDWSLTPVTLLRTPWDYSDDAAAFLRWIDAVAARTQLWNPARIVKWNLHKRYLVGLLAQGIATVPTVVIERGAAPDLGALLGAQRWADAVVKPAVGAGSRGARRFGGPGGAPLAEAQAHASALLAHTDVLVQPYLAQVETARERSLIFIAGRFSHAITKEPFNQTPFHAADPRARERAGAASSVELAFAERVLAVLPEPVLYARVDLVPAPGGPLLMELEVIEPSLFFGLAPQAADALAEALLQRHP